jgi:hypothetical protein
MAIAGDVQAEGELRLARRVAAERGDAELVAIYDRALATIPAREVTP